MANTSNFSVFDLYDIKSSQEEKIGLGTAKFVKRLDVNVLSSNKSI